MNVDADPDWSGEPQWKVTYVPHRVTAADAVVRDRGTPAASWYLAPWEADAVLADGIEFARLVNPTDPRLPRVAVTHPGPALVTLTCTRCGHRGVNAADFRTHTGCGDQPDTVDATTPSTSPMKYADPTCKEAWLAAARTGSLVDGIDPGWPSRDTDALEPWTVELSFDVDAYSREHAQQIANLLALITGGRVSGLS